MTQYSDKTTIDEAFNRYFDNENWRTYEKDGYSYVSFKGTCKYMGKTEDICIRFMITGEKFMVCGLDINGQIQSDALLKEFLTNIFEEDDSKEK